MKLISLQKDHSHDYVEKVDHGGQGNHLGVYCVNPSERDDGFFHGSSCGGEEKWRDV